MCDRVAIFILYMMMVIATCGAVQHIWGLKPALILFGSEVVGFALGYIL